MLHEEDKENGELDEAEEESDEGLRKELDDLSVKKFLQTISDTLEDVHSFAAFIDISDLNLPDRENSRKKADALAKAIWQELGYRFPCVHFQMPLFC